jgi:1-carboxybiuret hydrolase
MTTELHQMTAVEIARRIRSGDVRAADVCEAFLGRVAAANDTLRVFTDVAAERARDRAARIDAARARSEPLPPLAGVPFAAKNLFDIQGLPTRAGSKINRDRVPAKRDSTLVSRLDAAGGLLLGALNMGEYAYDFTGENIHDGSSVNPHDRTRMSGGSSGGSAAAVAAGFVSVALASDTNGSIRVPSSLCGLFGLKPTFGRLSRAGTFPFVPDLDHLGPIARSAGDLALAYDAMLGADPADLHQTKRAAEPVTPTLLDSDKRIRARRLDGYFEANLTEQARRAVTAVSEALGTARSIELPDVHRARAAAFIITGAQGAELHLSRLQTRAKDFDPAIRDRLIAGSTIPAAWVQRAQRVRTWFRNELAKVFADADILVAASTPCVAPELGETMLMLNGRAEPLRPNLGILTQPISFIGLPVVSVPIWLDGAPLPIGVQLIAPPWREDLALTAAHRLEKLGVARSPVARI